MAFFSLHCPNCISTLGSTRVGSVGIIMFWTVSGVLHLEKSTSGGLGVEYIQSSLDILGKLCLSTYCISSSGYVQVSGRKFHTSIQTIDSRGTMLDGGSPHSSQHVGRCSSALFCHKRSWCGWFSRPGVQGSAMSVFNPLAARRYVLCRQTLNLNFI